MTPQTRRMWDILRKVGPFLIFVVLFLVLAQVIGWPVLVSAGVAGAIALTDYLILTWMMKRQSM